MVGAHLVARIQGNQGRARFTTGLLTGSVLVGTVATLHGSQAVKDRHLEAASFQRRLHQFSHELAQVKRDRDGLEAEKRSLQQTLADRSQAAQAAASHLKPVPATAQGGGGGRGKVECL
jgi:septal ring factor EnvC (AmiA/AmiB activator)